MSFPTRPTTSAGLLAAVAAAGALTLAANDAEAKSCWAFGTVTATAGIAVKKDTAEKYARINWRVKVRAIATLGTAYDDWSLAEQRSYNCAKKLGTWRCNATAQPCRP